MLRTALPCTCGICGRLVIDARTAHIDHIVPLSKGGTGAPGATAARHSSACALLGTSPKLWPVAELGATVEPSSKN
jgi:hypothetical protein